MHQISFTAAAPVLDEPAASVAQRAFADLRPQFDINRVEVTTGGPKPGAKITLTFSDKVSPDQVARQKAMIARVVSTHFGTVS